MKSNVLLCVADRGLVAPIRGHGTGRVRAHRRQAGRGRQRHPRNPSIAAPEQKAKPKVRAQAAPRRNTRATSSNFFRVTSCNAPAAPGADAGAKQRTRHARSAQGQGASQFMLQRAASSYSTSSNALGFGLYRVTPRETVSFKERHVPGTILVRQREKRLYYVQRRRHRDPLCHRGRPRGRGLGRHLERLRQARMAGLDADAGNPAPQPDLPRHVDGGPANPMGARALYLGQTMYRIHGTNEPWRIGEEASSGCIRLTNDDIVDLYNRTRLGATVIVTR